MSAIDTLVCPDCEGSGYGPDDERIEFECCGNVLKSGECCAALYGEANLVPIPVPIQTACERCGGYGEVELR